MGYLHGQGVSVSVGTESWEGDVTRVVERQDLDNAQVEVMQQAFANTVTGAYHTIFTLDIAIQDGLTATDLVTGADAQVDVTLGTPDKLTVTSGIVTDVNVVASVEGAITGTITIAGNSVFTHTVA